MAKKRILISAAGGLGVLVVEFVLYGYYHFAQPIRDNNILARFIKPAARVLACRG